MFSAAGQLSWKADDNYLFKTLGISTTAANTVLVTTDPALTVTQAAAPSASKVLEDDIIFCSNAAGRNQMVVTVPVIEGTTLFVSAGAICSATMYLAPFE